MAKIVECVPNISEGRDRAVIEAVVDEVRGTAGVTLLDYSSNESHNRSVITMIGSPEGVVEAAARIAVKAAHLIDMTRHKGEHPRMGAVDVIPFIPIKEVSMEDCVALSRQAAQRIWEEAGMPVYLYEKSASAPHREDLAAVRRGQFEGMEQKVQQEGWEPDFGGRTVHPTAGVVAVGARMPLVAYNINLSTSDIGIANRIARVIRRSGGGLDCVKAIGVELEDRNMAQVSINMTDCSRTPLYRVQELVRMEAARYGVHIVEAEVVGLTPMTALIDSAAYYLQLNGFRADLQVIEGYLV